MSAEDIVKMTREAKDAARRLYAANESLGKYLHTAKAAKLDLSNLKNLARTVEDSKPDLSNLKNLKRTVDNTNKKILDISKITDALKRGDFKRINSSWGSRFSSFLAILNAGATTLLIKKNEEIQEANIETQRLTEADLQTTFTRTLNNSAQIKTLQKTTQQLKQSDQKTRDRVYGIEKQQVTINQKANDALYETRKGREIVETKIAKQASDIATIKAQISKTLSGINENFQKSVNTTITNLQKSLQQANGEIQKANNQISIQSKIVTELQSGVKSIQNSVTNIPKTIDTKIEDLKQFTIKLINGKTQPVEIEQKSIKQDLQQIKSNGITKTEIEATNASLRKTYEQSFESQAQQWQKEIQKQNDEFWNKKVSVTLTSTTKTTATNAEKIADLEKEIKNNKSDLDKLNTRLGDQEKVNKDALPKLDQILGFLPLIPAKTANFITPSIPTKADLEQAAAVGTCRTTQPGGCSRKMMDDAVNNINQNANKNKNDLLDKFNAGANSAELVLLNTINTKLGPQLPGGVSTFLVDFFTKFNKVAKWLHLDRVLNVLIWWQTLHNAYMLSANLGQTLTSAISNVLAAVGIKDAEGSPLDIGEILGGQFDALAKSVIGESEWGSIKAEYKKWNRIYQAAANLMNSIQSIGYSILSALEVVGSWVALIGNGLRKWGEMGETAYRWMNPTPNFQNKFFTALENTENVVSQIDVVASEVLSVQETVTQIGQQKQEFLNALEGKEGSRQGTEPPEATQVKTGFDAAKLASATGLAITEEDKEPDE